MRVLLTLLGAAAIAVYALAGMMLANEWALVAAAGVPLPETIERMADAREWHTTIPGIGFAVIGILLALAWAVFALLPRQRRSGWLSLGVWAMTVTAGAPAYWWASFANLHRVGDVFVDWDAQAAFIAASPLYLASLIALPVGVLALVQAGLRRRDSTAVA